MQNAPGDLGSRVGMIYASISAASIVFVYLVVPEMRGRSLEELDEMFQAGVPAWRSRAFKGTGIGARVTAVQNANSEGVGRVLVGLEAGRDGKESAEVVAVEESPKGEKEKV